MFVSDEIKALHHRLPQEWKSQEYFFTVPFFWGEMESHPATMKRKRRGNDYAAFGS